jgi:nitrous oxidase accessory protein
MFTKNVLMDNNIFKHNWGAASYGLLLKDISDSDIINNHFEENSVGIFIEGCTRIMITKNDFIKNGWAIKLMANSMSNIFNQNNFIANSFDVSTNSKQNFNTFKSNYWSNYSGYDLDKNGFGDVPFRPVTMFSMMVESHSTSLILLNSLFIQILDIAERVIPALTPDALMDLKPRMKIIE